jgi:TonB family protein
LSKDVVLSFIQKHLREIEQCAAGSVARGNIVLELTTTPDGRIKSAKVVSGTLNNSNAEQCLLETVKKWRFPATQGGREGTARVSLVFGQV